MGASNQLCAWSNTDESPMRAMKSRGCRACWRTPKLPFAIHRLASARPVMPFWGGDEPEAESDSEVGAFCPRARARGRGSRPGHCAG
jgi:hypothetical protein